MNNSIRIPPSMREEIVHGLQQLILAGELRPDERLNERVLSERFGVSRPPLREAIRQLEAEGLVTSIPRRGSYVRSFSGDEIRELYSLRYALESAAAEYVSLAGEADDFDALEQRLIDVEMASSTADHSVLEKDLLFHREIVLRSQSRSLLHTWDNLVRELKLALLYLDPAFYAFAFVEKTHRPLLTAMKHQDLEQIRSWTRELRNVGDSLGLRWERQKGESL